MDLDKCLINLSICIKDLIPFLLVKKLSIDLLWSNPLKLLMKFFLILNKDQLLKDIVYIVELLINSLMLSSIKSILISSVLKSQLL